MEDFDRMAQMAESRQELAYLMMQQEETQQEIEKYRNMAKAQEEEFFEFLEHFQAEGMFSGFGYLVQMFDLNRLERHCLLMAWYALMYSLPDSGGIYGKEGITVNGLWLSFPWEISLMELSGQLAALKRRPFFGLFFEKNVYFLKETCRLHPYAMDFLNGEYHFESYRFFSAEEGREMFFYGGEEPLAAAERMLGKESLQETGGKRRVLLLSGEDGMGKHTMARCLAGRLGLDLLEADMEAVAEDFWEVYVLTLRLHRLCPLIRLTDTKDGLEVFENWRRERGLLPVLFLLAGEEAEELFEAAARMEIELISFPLEKYPARIQKQIWQREGSVYPAFPERAAVLMAEQFDLSAGQIRQILGAAEQERRRQQKESMTEEILNRACGMVLGRNMGNKALKTESTYQMEDLVLPKHQKQLLLQACAQVKNRKLVFSEWGFSKKMAYGRGISMIFAGPPGTGKTMAALVMANRIGMELYRVNLPVIVSKYIGETEKNLEEIFTYAAKSQVILFFDEADVLFSKRTEVKEANDKYNNMEAAFLLQKMEQYEGVVILATNFLKNFDDAFRRRVRFIVDFPFPGAAERKEIWKRVFPEQIAHEEIDWEFLSEEFELSGSNIRNAALLAAFLAAEEKERLSMKHIIEALKQEYAKNGKILGKEELKEYAV